MAAKKFGMSFETHGSQIFGRDIPGIFAGISRGGRPQSGEKFEKKHWGAADGGLRDGGLRKSEEI